MDPVKQVVWKGLKVSIMKKLQINQEDRNSSLLWHITQWLLFTLIFTHYKLVALEITKEYVTSGFSYRKKRTSHTCTLYNR